MAERGLKGPFFYMGHFQYRSILSEELTKEQRVEYRGLYRNLLKSLKKRHGSGRTQRIKARTMMRDNLLYPEFGKMRRK